MMSVIGVTGVFNWFRRVAETLEHTRLRYTVLATTLMYAFLQQAVYAPLGIGLGDEGYRFYLAWVASRPDTILYADIWTRYAPGHVWLAEAVMRLFGFRFVIYRLYFAVLGVLLTVVVYFAVSEATERMWPGVSAAIFMTFAIVPVLPQKADRLLLPMVFVVLALRTIRRGITLRRAGILGITAGSAMIMSQDSGIFVFVSFFLLLVLTAPWGEVSILALVQSRGQILITFIIGFTAPVTPVVLYFAAKDALFPLIDSLFLSLPSFSEQMSIPLWFVLLRPFRRLDPTLSGIVQFLWWLPPAVWFILTPVVSGMVTFSVGSRLSSTWSLSTDDQELLYLTAVAMAFYTVAMGRSDMSHLAYALPPTVVLVFVGVDKLLPVVRATSGHPDRNYRRIIVTVATTLLLLSAVAWGQGVHYLNLGGISENEYVAADYPHTDGTYVTQQNDERLRSVVSVVQQHVGPERQVVVLPYKTGYNVLTETVSPIRYPIFLPGSVPPDRIDEIIMRLDRIDALVVYARDSGAFMGTHDVYLSESYPRLHRFITEQCEPLGGSDGTVVYSC